MPPLTPLRPPSGPLPSACQVAGDRDSLTAFQMDIKVEGITIPVLAQALAAARSGRRRLLDAMEKCAPPPRRALSPHAPRIERFTVDPKFVGAIIGPGGKNIRALIDTTGVVAVDIDSVGVVRVTGPASSVAMASERIRQSVQEPQLGHIYR